MKLKKKKSALSIYKCSLFLLKKIGLFNGDRTLKIKTIRTKLFLTLDQNE